jgi:uncharacterized protein YndB with AHSA1/START domain
MTRTEQAPAGPAEASPDYRATIRVQATADALFDALTSSAGLAGWWTRVTGSGAAGGELRFFMNAPEPLVIRVEEAVRPASVRWTVTACDFPPDWVGTGPEFTIIPAGDGVCEVRFVHHGLTPDLDCREMCTRGWDHFIVSLRDYAETGHGSPHDSSGDRARRAREALL